MQHRHKYDRHSQREESKNCSRKCISGSRSRLGLHLRTHVRLLLAPRALGSLVRRPAQWILSFRETATYPLVQWPVSEQTGRCLRRTLSTVALGMPLHHARPVADHEPGGGFLGDAAADTARTRRGCDGSSAFFFRLHAVIRSCGAKRNHFARSEPFPVLTQSRPR